MLTFIKSTALKKTIEDSVEYMNVLFDTTKDSSSDAYKEETYRVIILYVVAVIEAILLYVLKERGDEIMSVTYKNASEISKKVKHEEYPKDIFVTAIQCKEVKADQQIGVQDLVGFMKRNKLMRKKTAEGILEINNIRNTFHLNKSRTNISLELEKVERAFSLLYKIIEGAPKAIAKEK